MLRVLSLLALTCLGVSERTGNPLRSERNITGDAPFGQVLNAYYSGISASTVGAGGINSLSLAFFSPAAMLQSDCDFTDPTTGCVKPAAGAGSSLGLKWALDTMTQTLPGLSGNTSPKRGGKPVIFFSFGGQTEGGAAWDTIFGSSQQATLFGQNCGKLANDVTASMGGKLVVGIDLDIEGTKSELPHFADFLTAFRALAPFEQFPLMMCALSGLASPDSSDHFKVSLFQQYGPAQKGLNFLNMMVNNVASSCTDMSQFWRNPVLDFLPPQNRLFGFWGLNLAAWLLKNPGCTDGPDPLYPWMKTQGVGMGIWQWWSGDPSPIAGVINQVRQGA